MPARTYDRLSHPEKVLAGRIALNALLDECSEPGTTRAPSEEVREACDAIRSRYRLRYQVIEAFMADAVVEEAFRRAASRNAHEAVIVGHFDTVIDLERLATR